MAGRMSCAQLPRPEAGNSPSWTETNITSIRPSQKVAIDCPRVALTITR